jgi:hypothetical protein
VSIYDVLLLLCLICIKFLRKIISVESVRGEDAEGLFPICLHVAGDNGRTKKGKLLASQCPGSATDFVFIYSTGMDQGFAHFFGFWYPRISSTPSL